MKKVVYIFLGMFIVIFYIAGCSYHGGHVETGKLIKEYDVKKIVDGRTTGAEILAWFGAPTKSSRLGKEELFVYRHCTTDSSAVRVTAIGSSKSKEKCDELSVVLNENGVVKMHSYVPAPE